MQIKRKLQYSFCDSFNAFVINMITFLLMSLKLLLQVSLKLLYIEEKGYDVEVSFYDVTKHYDVTSLITKSLILKDHKFDST